MWRYTKKTWNFICDKRRKTKFSDISYERKCAIFPITSSPEDMTADAVPEPFIHLSQQTENMDPCYLKSELSKLNQKDLYFDGTFSLVRNLDNNQIYIVRIVYSNGGTAVFSCCKFRKKAAVFSVILKPITCFYMRTEFEMTIWTEDAKEF